ncbi:hypothetical protein ACJX0J_027241, partial [Zea mays]
EVLHHKYLVKNWYWPNSSSICLTHLPGILVIKEKYGHSLHLMDISGLFLYTGVFIIFKHIEVFLFFSKTWGSIFLALFIGRTWPNFMKNFHLRGHFGLPYYIFLWYSLLFNLVPFAQLHLQ